MIDVGQLTGEKLQDVEEVQHVRQPIRHLLAQLTTVALYPATLWATVDVADEARGALAASPFDDDAKQLLEEVTRRLTDRGT